jgi:uncharacterized protein (TIGR02996 family)
MSDADSLLAAIVADPEDDLPRLAYADWLDENGDPDRAEFIRVQIELAKLSGGDSRRGPLAEREAALLAAHAAAWSKGLTKAGLKAPQFRRGFVERASLGDVSRFLRQADALFRREPIREIAYTWGARPPGQLPPGWLDDLIASPHAGRITEIESSHPDDVELLTYLVGRAKFDGLVKLRFTARLDNGGEEVAAWVARASHLRRLRHLTIWAYDVGDGGLAALAGAKHLRNLQHLDLGDAEEGTSSGISADGVEALTASRHLRRLRHLDLTGNWIEDRGAELLAAYGASLEALRVVGCGIEERGLLALLSSESLTGLRELAIDVQAMSLRTARAIAASPRAGRLRRLSLYVWPDDEEDEDLTERETFRRLFGVRVLETIERGLGERVEFHFIDWTE